MSGLNECRVDPLAVFKRPSQMTSSHGDVVAGEVPLVGEAVTAPVLVGWEAVVDVAVTVPGGGGGGAAAEVAIAEPVPGGGGGFDAAGDDDDFAGPLGAVAGDDELDASGLHPTTPAARQRATNDRAEMTGRP